MGSDDFEDSKPVHSVTVNGFWMDEHEVTNSQFEKFVKATGYITVAEQKLNPKDYPGVPEDKLVPGSAVFTTPSQKVSLNDPRQWWQYVNGANWRYPKGPGSSIKGQENDPVVQVSIQMLLLMLNGPVSACLQKQNGNMQHVPEKIMQNIIGVMN